MTDVVFVINAGSSSLKFSAFEPAAAGEPALVFKGQMEGIGVHPHLSVRGRSGETLIDKSYERSEIANHESAIAAISQWLRGGSGDFRLIAVGHRVVHGGPDFAAPVRVDPEILARLDALSPLAPLHQPGNLAGIRAVAARQPSLPQVACFDTAFHRGHSALVERFAIPEALFQEGVRRYGFHGLSYEFIARRLPTVAPELARGRVVVAHLGSGASMCAMVAGRSVDSTMGFTALDGLPMGTRSGALDPGVVIHLVRSKGLSPDAVEKMLYNDCGLLGLSGISNDMRDLLQSGEPRAKLAVDYFVHHIARQLGALAAVMQGLDGIVFTAGIGERSAEIRARVLERAAWLGTRLDPAANNSGGPRISAPDARVSAWVVPTDEELMIGIHTLDLVGR